jgi:hypothetical protein
MWNPALCEYKIYLEEFPHNIGIIIWSLLQTHNESKQIFLLEKPIQISIFLHVAEFTEKTSTAMI